MGILSFLLEDIFYCDTVERYFNSLKLREALQNLSKQHNFEVLMWYQEKQWVRFFYDEKRPIENFKEITVEVCITENLRRIHIDYDYSEGFNKQGLCKLVEHYGQEEEGNFFESIGSSNISFLRNNKRVSDFEKIFIEIANRLADKQNSDKVLYKKFSETE